MVRTDPRITDRQTHPHSTARVSVETYRPRGETIGFKKKDIFSHEYTSSRVSAYLAVNRDRQFLFIEFYFSCFGTFSLHLEFRLSTAKFLNNGNKSFVALWTLLFIFTRKSSSSYLSMR